MEKNTVSEFPDKTEIILDLENPIWRADITWGYARGDGYDRSIRQRLSHPAILNKLSDLISRSTKDGNYYPAVFLDNLFNITDYTVSLAAYDSLQAIEIYSEVVNLHLSLITLAFQNLYNLNFDKDNRELDMKFTNTMTNILNCINLYREWMYEDGISESEEFKARFNYLKTNIASACMRFFNKANKKTKPNFIAVLRKSNTPLASAFLNSNRD